MNSGMVIKKLHPENYREKVYYCDCCKNASEVKITLTKQEKMEKSGVLRNKTVTKDINLCSVHFTSMKQTMMYIEVNK